MADSQILTVIRTWAAVAWADGVLAVPEAEGLYRLIANADLTEDERAAAEHFATERVSLPESELAGLSSDARKGIYRAACRMAMVDHVFAASERALLDRLAGVLRVPGDVAREVEAEVPGMATNT